MTGLELHVAGAFTPGTPEELWNAYLRTILCWPTFKKTAVNLVIRGVLRYRDDGTVELVVIDVTPSVLLTSRVDGTSSAE